ncbi:MAG: hypothetical protein IKC04_02990, partial [Oscillospiraceae bacterium]|nr:hypothetical protein [Oscillospiraceae bacterium]
MSKSVVSAYSIAENILFVQDKKVRIPGGDFVFLPEKRVWETAYLFSETTKGAQDPFCVVAKYAKLRRFRKSAIRPLPCSSFPQKVCNLLWVPSAPKENG